MLTLARPGSVVGQLNEIGADLRANDRLWREQIGAVAARLVDDVELVVVGCGDSAAAAHAGVAFLRSNGLPATAMSPWDVIGGASSVHMERIALIGISISGESTPVVEAVRTACREGASTIAITGERGSALGCAADEVIDVGLRDRPLGPGLRTYFAVLHALAVLADAVGQPAKSAFGPTTMATLASQVDVAVADAAGITAVADCLIDGPVAVVGTRPSASVDFAVAKLVELSGLVASGHDLEEWWHVHRYRVPIDLPVVVIVPDGIERGRAIEVAQGAASLGRRVVVIGDLADAVVPGATVIDRGPLVVGGSLFVDPLWVAAAAALIADRLGRTPLRLGESGFRL